MMIIKAPGYNGGNSYDTERDHYETPGDEKAGKEPEKDNDRGYDRVRNDERTTAGIVANPRVEALYAELQRTRDEIAVKMREVSNLRVERSENVQRILTLEKTVNVRDVEIRATVRAIKNAEERVKVAKFDRDTMGAARDKALEEARENINGRRASDQEIRRLQESHNAYARSSEARILSDGARIKELEEQVRKSRIVGSIVDPTYDRMRAELFEAHTRIAELEERVRTSRLEGDCRGI